MGRQKPSRAASQLQAVSKALVRERQVQNWAKEIADKIATLQKQREAAEREMAEIQEILNADPDLTAIARQMMKKAVTGRGTGDGDFVVYNPKYVASDDKQRLLEKILQDYIRENSGSDGISFSAIKSVLRNRYGIETASAGLFFRNELKKYKTKGGNKNKSVVLNPRQI